MKLYIPFNMIIETDVGVLKSIEKVNNLPEWSINKFKSFLIKREEMNPLPEYCKLRNIEYEDGIYEMIINKFYKKVVELSIPTDLLSFVINTYKLGISKSFIITVVSL